MDPIARPDTPWGKASSIVIVPSTSGENSVAVAETTDGSPSPSARMRRSG